MRLAQSLSICGQPIVTYLAGTLGAEQQYAIPQEVCGDDYVLTLGATVEPPTAEELENIYLAYRLPFEMFDDFPPAPWANAPHRALRPGDTFTSHLFVNQPSSTLEVEYFNIPDSYADVFVNGILVHHIVGGETDIGEPGWQVLARVPLAQPVQGAVEVSFTTPELAESSGFAIRAVRLQSQ